MGFHRQTQHKPSHQDQRAREVTDLKRDNQHLKKQIGRLRKQIGKMVDLHGLDIPVDPDANEIPDVIEEEKETLERCEKCGGDAKIVEVGGKAFVCCLSKCGWKKMLKNSTPREEE